MKARASEALDASLANGGSDVDGLRGNVDGRGGEARGKPIWMLDQIVENMTRKDAGWIWHDDPNSNYMRSRSGSEHVLTFGFQTAQSMQLPAYNFDPTHKSSEYQEFAPLSRQQMAAARIAVESWDDVVAIRLEETAPEQADVNFGNGAITPFQGFTYTPSKADFKDRVAALGSDSIELQAGDVWIGARGSNLDLRAGGYGSTSLIHELGHALGLAHTGDYDGAVGLPTYEKSASYYQDSWQYAVMSYWDGEKTGASTLDWRTFSRLYPATPLIHDIAAAQALYGPDMTTRAGDTVYGFNSTANNPIFNFAQNSEPVLAIWDGGGSDTLDFSGWSTPSTIDLNPGGFSSGGGVPTDHIPTLDEVNAARAAARMAPCSQADYATFCSSFGQYFTDGLMRDNISIAYGAAIENAVGGGGDDIIIGNAVANVIDGHAGRDTASYREAKAGVEASLLSNSGSAGDAKGDRYIAIENLEGSAFGDILSGGQGGNDLFGLGGDDQIDGGVNNDTLDGAAGNDLLQGVLGNDRLLGDDGDDRLDGGPGDDLLVGGAGNDIFAFTYSPGKDRLDAFPVSESDRIEDFHANEDRIDLSRLDAKPPQPNEAAAVLHHFSWIGGAAFSKQEGELRASGAGSAYRLEGDIDGDGVADLTILTSVPITPADLLLG